MANSIKNSSQKNILQLLLSIIFCLSSIILTSQINYPTRNANYIFWKQGLVIDASDYKGTPHSGTGAALSNVAIWTVFDVPKVKSEKIKIHIAPVFICDFSSRTSNDSMEIVFQNAYLDICEIASRAARKKSVLILNSTNNYDSLSAAFITIIKEMNEDRLRRTRLYNRNVINNKKATSFQSWRKTLDEELENTKQWTTSPEDCYRFIKNAPLDVTHSEDEKLNPKMNDGLYEKILERDTWHAEFYQVSRRRIDKHK